MQQHNAKPKRFSAVASTSARSLLSPVRTMQQPVSSAASPVFFTTPTGRSSTMFTTTSKAEFSTPVFSLPFDIGVGEKVTTDVFAPVLREVSPTSVASPLAAARIGGISRGHCLSGGIGGIRLNYDHRSPSHEMVFEPVDRETSRRVRVPMACPPCSNVNINVDDTAEVQSPTKVASASSHPQISASFFKLRNGSLGSTNGSSHHGRSRASTMSPTPTSHTPQNLRDNPERLAKVKTEMCRYYELGGTKNCPWGDKCE